MVSKGRNSPYNLVHDRVCACICTAHTLVLYFVYLDNFVAMYIIIYLCFVMLNYTMKK